MTVVVPRDEIGLAAPTRKPIIVPGSDRYGIVVHWNGPAMRIDPNDPAGRAVEIRRLQGIQRYHQQTQKWSDVAYSWAVGQATGNVYELRGDRWDQFANGDDEVGPDDGPDRRWFTVLWLGGEGEAPSPQALAGVQHAIRLARNAGAGLRVLPHLDLKKKPCPGPELTALCRRFDGRPLDEGTGIMDDKTRDDLLVELVGRVRSMHVGSFGESDLPYNLPGDLGWLDRRLDARARWIVDAVNAAEAGGIEVARVTLDDGELDRIAVRVVELLAGRLQS